MGPKILPIRRRVGMIIELLVLFCLAPNVYAQTNDVSFNPKRGFYDAAFQLTITSPFPGATIRYTTNGTAPTTSSGTIYSGPITISTTTPVRAIAYDGIGNVTRANTSTYIFLDNVLQQPKNISGWPNNTYSLGSGSATAVHDYEMDPNVVNNPAYSGVIKNAMKAIPTMSIVMDKDKFWESYDSEPDIENPASIEVIYPSNPNGSEQVDCGLEPHSHKRLKRSIRLKFKSQYGFSHFNTQLFATGPVNGAGASTVEDNIVLRGGNNRSWARNWNPDRTEYTRDEWYRQSQVEASNIGGRGSFVHLYVNGLYWGLYNPVERPDDNYAAIYNGGNSTDYFSMNHDGNGDGDPARFNYLSSTLIAKDMTNAANYNELKQYLDVESYCDYLIITWMTGMTDWPSNNFYGGNRNNPAGPFRYYTWDCEWSWDVTNGSNLGAWVHPAFRNNVTSSSDVIPSIWIAARKNPDFMATFADRVQKLCFNNGPLTDANSITRWQNINNFIKDGIIGESARWGDALNDGVTRTKNDYWQPEVTRVQGLMNGNVSRLITALRGQGYFSSLNAVTYNSNGGNVSAGFNLVITNPNATGSIYFTTDGSDPRASGGGNSPSATLYSGPVVINSSKTIKARVKDGSNWSSMSDVSFTVQNSGLISGIFINEFMASNTTTIVDEFGGHDDWIEIYNNNNNPIDIGGLFITDKLTAKGQWQIPTSDPAKTTIPAKGYLIIWADGETAQGVLHISAKLSNSGEQIGIFQKVGSDTLAIDTYTFGAQTANVSEGRFPDGSANFIFFSTATPGATNTVSAIAGLYINEFLASNSADTTDEFGDHEDWIEIYNNSPSPIDIGGLYITDNLSNPGLYQIPTTDASKTTIPSKGFLVLWADSELAEGILHMNLKLSNGGEQIGLFQKFGASFIPLDSLTFGAQTADISSGRYPDASKNMLKFTSPTFNSPNIIPVVTGLYINEFLAGNTANIVDEFNEHDDWIEIYNDNNFPVNIGGLFVTDKLSSPTSWQIPTNNTAQTTIPAKGFKVIWADKQSGQGPLHVDIKLAQAGEQIGLVQQNGSTIIYIDSLTFGAQLDDVSQGRLPDGTSTFTTFSSPTPGISNQVVNHSPIVDAGLDKQLTLPQDTITLKSIASDQDNDPLSYLWRKKSGPAITLGDTTKSSLKLQGLIAGQYTFTVTVRDPGNATATDSVHVTVFPIANGVISFTLVNADTDLDIRTLKATDTINLAQFPRINIRANTNPSVTGSVVFTLNGSKKTENSAPYSLKGDNSGNYTAWTPTLGTYTLNGISWSQSGATGVQGTGLTINFLVINNTGVNQPPVANAGSDKSLTLPTNSVTLTGSGTDNDGNITSYLWTKTSGPSATMSGTGTSQLSVTNMVQGTYVFRLTVTDNKNATAFDEATVVVSPQGNQPPVANAGPDKSITLPTNSVTLTGSGTDIGGSISSYAWTKTSGPSATLSGSTTSQLVVTNMVQGTYVFRLTVTDNQNATGFDEATVIVSPQVSQGPQVISFTLINADTDKDIQTISNGATFNLAQLPTKNLNVRANTNPATVGSVVFNLNGSVVTENAAPYALKGDNNGNYNPWTPKVGAYTLSGKAYSAKSGTGTSGATFTVTFNVTNSAAKMAAALMEMENEEMLSLNSFPNPAVDVINVQFTSNIAQHVRMEILDEYGSIVEVLYDGIAEKDQTYIQQIDGSNLKGGYYISRLVTDQQVKTQKIIIMK